MPCQASSFILGRIVYWKPYTSSLTVDQMANVTTAATAKYKIGEQLDGGIIFYIDSSGEHGLMAAPVDPVERTGWCPAKSPHVLAMTVRDGIGMGRGNTEKIIDKYGPGDYAAILCARYQLNGIGDWYLPSIYELELMIKTIGEGANGPNRNIGRFNVGYYWSSNEKNDSEAFVVASNNGARVHLMKRSDEHVRAIRTF